MQNEKTVFHNVIMESRNKLFITGITDIDSFNDQIIIAVTVLGTLIIKGSELHIGKINIDDGDMNVDGKIDSLTYSDSYSKKDSSVFKKFFK